MKQNLSLANKNPLRKAQDVLESLTRPLTMTLSSVQTTLVEYQQIVPVQSIIVIIEVVLKLPYLTFFTASDQILEPAFLG